MSYSSPQGQPYYPHPQPKRRKVWPWVLLAVVLVPLLAFGGCVALLGAGATAVDNARKGGTVAIGETFTYASGLAISVSEPTKYKASNPYVVPSGHQAYEVTVTITNGTTNPVGAALITTNVTVNSAPAQQVYDGVIWPTQDIAPGQQLKAGYRFEVPKGTTGPLQVAVTDSFNEPVFFTGELGKTT